MAPSGANLDNGVQSKEVIVELMDKPFFFYILKTYWS